MMRKEIQENIYQLSSFRKPDMKLAAFIYLIIGFLLANVPHAAGQLGGSNTYEFLNLPQSPRISALGGGANALLDDDITLVAQNPASLNPDMHHALSFNTALYFSDINFGYFGYGYHLQPWATTFGGSIQYINYGKFAATDLNGNSMGEFKAAEYAINLSAARQFKKFRYGTNLKLITSSLESYNSFGSAFDFGGMYEDTANLFTAAIVVRNIGLQIKPFVPGNREPLPFEIQAGITKKLEHLPFRFSVVIHNLQKPDIRYDDPRIEVEKNPFAGDTTPPKEKKYILDKIARHFILGGEFMLGQNLRIRFGYNHLRRQELSLASRRSTIGFSMGAGLRISKFRMDYSVARYHLAGSSHHFSLSVRLSDFIRK